MSSSAGNASCKRQADTFHQRLRRRAGAAFGAVDDDEIRRALDTTLFLLAQLADPSTPPNTALKPTGLPVRSRMWLILSISW
jgi:broad specificity phosphatase PhoE